MKTQSVSPFVKLLCEDRRYKLEAYDFVRLGLTYAQEVLELGGEEVGPPRKDGSPRPRHVSGQDLCWALRELAQEQYGRLAKLVLAEWGIRSTGDFGEIVYNLIRIGEMAKSPTDRREDFDDVYDFQEALVHQFVITREPQGAAK